MLIVAGQVQIKPEMREEAVQAALTMAKATQAEDGCIAYRFYSPLDDPNTFFIFEQWESEAALQAHFQTPHMATFREVLPRVLAGEMAIKRYDVSNVTDL